MFIYKYICIYIDVSLYIYIYIYRLIGHLSTLIGAPHSAPRCSVAPHSAPRCSGGASATSRGPNPYVTRVNDTEGVAAEEP